MMTPRSRFIRQPEIDTTLRVRAVRGPCGEPVLEFAELLHGERSDGALEVREGGRVHLTPERLAELASAASCVSSEALAEYAETARGGRRLKARGSEPAAAPAALRARPGGAREGEF